MKRQVKPQTNQVTQSLGGQILGECSTDVQRVFSEPSANCQRALAKASARLIPNQERGNAPAPKNHATASKADALQLAINASVHLLVF